MVAPSESNFESTALRSPTQVPVRPLREGAATHTKTPRIPLTDVHPMVPGGWIPTTAVSHVVPFSTIAFREGHEHIAVFVRLRDPDNGETLHRMLPLNDGTDRWQADIQFHRTGDWTFRCEAYADEFGTWAHAANLKLRAGVDVPLMCRIGSQLLERAASDDSRPSPQRRMLLRFAASLADAQCTVDAALAITTDPDLAAAMFAQPLTSLPSATPWHPLRVERERAGIGAWYEFFPRSEGAQQAEDGTIISGTFATATERLPGVAAMGFDVLYLPPIHPIGRTHRKGRNNTLDAQENDPGSPWAIGSSAGGHDAIHPDLGTLDDFRRFINAAADHGIEIALDLALQASPDHPWVQRHPEWFTTLPDGSIAYAENPPKKYQDIYPLNFDNDPEGLFAEIVRIVEHWIAAGVKIFRVDNPHTKPLWLWERLLATINATHPEVIFLAEAFTRPAPLRALAAVGFHQSYSYFTWRNTKAELEEFLTSIATETADYLRPNLFVNTPDILTEYLQYGGPAAYRIRAAIAATASPLYGVYAGYELIENVARPGAEENIDNEKYEYKLRDWQQAEHEGTSLAPYLRQLNSIRQQHPALRQLRNTRIHWSDDDSILVYSKHLDGFYTDDGNDDTIIVVVNVDPHSVRETTVHLDTRQWGVEPGEEYGVEDLLTGSLWRWKDHNYVRLDAFSQPVHILRVVKE
ncbi:maltotransferase domain-containing protein [Microbacterium sp. YY-01]|uniref:maltotransferase domain-containing protein n=1 Tax=Microbacterium sp. YY-01 TaxID=3421634 RepID=UPI003D1672FB